MPEQLPPLTTEDLKQALNNTTFSTYAYIGKEDDVGWAVARAVFKLLPALRVYLVTSRPLVAEWTTKPTDRGIVWGFGPNPKRRLLKAETDDVLVVMDAITAARS
jgi:hypothetical protein